MISRHADIRGWEGWDEYAPFYDWENARTLGRRDVPFWQRLASGARTGARARLRHRTDLAAARARRASTWSASIVRPRCSHGPRRVAAAIRCAPVAAAAGSALVRGDIRHLPFPAGTFRHRPRAVRHPAVAAARPRPRRDARRRRASWSQAALRHRPRARRAATGASTQPGPDARAHARRDSPDADRVGAPGTAAAPDDVRAALCRAPRPRGPPSTASS